MILILPLSLRVRCYQCHGLKSVMTRSVAKKNSFSFFYRFKIRLRKSRISFSKYKMLSVINLYKATT